ncbi:transcriptional regulator, LacI family [Draconibacterium orientale]|jgi:LacI family transcriptional regulator|uniref:LacI family transcriptional regulator n=1 Tax=Draconibacterium orientale TaxID=1168034 RepID=X5D9Z8_9BACT|nr:LacI family DNA-binding transcriptional regulator [Draconibacterium orientale]AHW59618.1 LacI family transcriptional regulator [Draconibacterium orientale]SES82294.1 transcriptional regulator, LacI family [Draconibacterium orientale]
MKSGLVTIKDLARELNISASTVSRALKDHPDISKETKRAVQELAQKLNYQPNAVALSLKQRRSNTIGVIIPEIVHYFFSSVISGIEDVAYEAGFNVIICQSNERYEREVANAKTLLASRVDGVLVSISKHTTDYKHFKNFQNNEVPIVFYDRVVPDIIADQVIIDDFDAAYRSTRHLIDSGRTRIAHLGGPMALLIGQNRKNGYLKALSEAGIPADENLILEADSFEKARMAIMKLINQKIKFDGVFATNDLTAIGAMQTIQKKGYKIPDEIAIVGFSDGRFSGITDPTLTSVDQHGYEMGTLATQMLLKRILSEDDEYPAETKVLNADLIVRGSSII